VNRYNEIIMNTTTTRRTFISTAASASALLYSNAAIAEAGPQKSIRADTHLHCFAGSANDRFPYHERAPYRPDKAASPQHLLRCMDQAGVDFAIVVHPEPYQDDNRYLEHCIEVGKGRLKGTALLFSDRAGSLEQLPNLVKKTDLVAVRVHAYAPDRLPPFGKPELRRLWKLATDHNLAVQLHFEPRYAAGFEPLIREFRDTVVIIDHLGRPFQGTPEEHNVVVKWSRFPNTVMKFSAIPDQLKYPHRDIQPVIRQLTNAYGADRMIYGGGFNADASGESYRAAFESSRALIDHLSAADQNKILGQTAARLFKFKS
jgi:predicted TIM-barrel fold metal-dependent hydrolase